MRGPGRGLHAALAGYVPSGRGALQAVRAARGAARLREQPHPPRLHQVDIRET